MHLRRATMDDALDVLAWRNDPLAVAMSKTAAAIEEAPHLAWFAKAIEDPSRVLLIAVEADRKLGMVRFDESGASWLVSINVAPLERGRGLGSSLLQMGVAEFRRSVGPNQLIAEVMEGNIASLHLFEGCGFSLRDRHDGFYRLTLG